MQIWQAKYRRSPPRLRARFDISPESTQQRHRALLDVSEKIAAHRDLSALFHALAETLHDFVHFDYLNLVLYDAVRQRMRLHVLETSEPVAMQTGREFPSQAQAMLYGMVQRQSMMRAFVDVFWLLARVFLAVIPLVFLMKKVQPHKGPVMAE